MQQLRRQETAAPILGQACRLLRPADGILRPAPLRRQPRLDLLQGHRARPGGRHRHRPSTSPTTPDEVQLTGLEWSPAMLDIAPAPRRAGGAGRSTCARVDAQALEFSRCGIRHCGLHVLAVRDPPTTRRPWPRWPGCCGPAGCCCSPTTSRPRPGTPRRGAGADRGGQRPRWRRAFSGAARSGTCRRWGFAIEDHDRLKLGIVERLARAPSRSTPRGLLVRDIYYPGIATAGRGRLLSCTRTTCR